MIDQLTKPVIGVTLGLTMEDHTPQIFSGYSFEFCKQQYYEAVEEHGAVILPIPNSNHVEHSAYYLELLDGLMIVGGEDIHPALYGQEPADKSGPFFVRRDNFEREMLFMAIGRKMPILGICRGHQLINVVFGGSLHQDLADRQEPTFDHRQTPARDFSNRHMVQIAEGSLLASLLGSTSCEVNSAHHQIIDRVPPGLRVAAQAEDGVIEALEGTGEGYLLSVQWHPEMEPDDPVSRAIFADFVRHALDFKTKKRYGGARTFL